MKIIVFCACVFAVIYLLTQGSLILFYSHRVKDMPNVHCVPTGGETAIYLNAVCDYALSYVKIGDKPNFKKCWLLKETFKEERVYLVQKEARLQIR